MYRNPLLFPPCCVKNADGDLPLHVAARYAAESVVLSLLDAHPNAAQVAHKCSEIPLHISVEDGGSIGGEV